MPEGGLEPPTPPEADCARPVRRRFARRPMNIHRRGRRDMTKGKRKRARRAARPAKDRPERGKDPRLVAVPAREMNGEELPPGTWVQVLSPVLMDDGREL